MLGEVLEVKLRAELGAEIGDLLLAFHQKETHSAFQMEQHLGLQKETHLAFRMKKCLICHLGWSWAVCWAIHMVQSLKGLQDSSLERT